MSMKTIDDRGAAVLVEAIVKQAKLDFMKFPPDSFQHKDAETFF